MGAAQFLEDTLMALPFGRWGILIAMQFILLILGCFLDPWGIIMIAIPIFVPILESLGFNLVWFGILFVINMEMAYLTPPVGLNVFFMKSVVPNDVTMGDIYRSVAPFLLLQALAMALIIIFPQLVMWLPSLMF